MVGFDELIFIGIVALLLFGPDKLPEYIRELGRWYAEFKKAQTDLQSEFNKAVTDSMATPKQPSATVIDIARKMDIPVEGKTEEELLKAIEAAVPAIPEKAQT
jgi:sec-independent protein translocase protein TatA